MSTGSAALMLEGAETLLVRSTTFRTKVQAADQTVARQKVFFGELADALELTQGATLQGKRPGAIIGIDRHGYVQIGQGARILLGGTGAVWLMLVDNHNPDHTHKEGLLAFVDWTSTVFDEISEDVGRDVQWPFNHFDMVVEPYRPAIGDRKSDDFWLTVYLLSHHINAPGG